MSAGPDVGSRNASPRSARLETITLTAYHHALVELSQFRDDPRTLVNLLGSVDQQASHPAAKTRLILAGRLIAAAQLSGPQELSEFEVRMIVRSWLAQRQAERDDAAPPSDLPIAKQYHASGLDRCLLECDRQGGLGRAAWEIAALILQHLVRPPMEVGQALSLRVKLEALAARALDLLCDSSPFGLARVELNGLLAHAAVRVRAASRKLTSDYVPWESDPLDDWLHIAASLIGGFALWTGASVDRSMRVAVTRATDRLAGSLVPDDPTRFSREVALEHAAHCAFDAAVTALGLTLHPDDAVLLEIKPDVLDSLVEATSSALIGGWVVDRIGPPAT